MSIRNKLNYFLVHQSGFTNKEAKELISNKKVFVNDMPVSENVIVCEKDEIRIGNKTLQEKINHKHVLFYKPIGIETTHNKKIENSFVNKFPELSSFFFAGRLDKDSEGLLFLTTDGKLANNLAHPLFQKEKEYLVEVNAPIDENFKNKMEAGVEIMGKTTATCTVKIISNTIFQIILKEGKNRQIRRMCYKLGYKVISLKRTKIADWEIGNLKEGEWRETKLS